MRISSLVGIHNKNKATTLTSQNEYRRQHYRMYFYHWATISYAKNRVKPWWRQELHFEYCDLLLCSRPSGLANHDWPWERKSQNWQLMPFNLMDNLIGTFHKVYEQEACEQKQISGFCFIVKLNWNKIQKSGGVHRLMRREGKCLLQQSKIVTVIYFYRLKKFCGMLKKSYSQSCVHKWSFSWCPALNGTLAP